MAGSTRKPDVRLVSGQGTDGHADMVARARTLIPELRERASRTEALRRLPPETERALHDTGLFRILQPKRVGGSELDYVALVDCADALGQADASVAWNFANLSSHHWMLGMFDPRAQDEVWSKDVNALIASSFIFPAGRARKSKGGYTLSGHWPFSSGVESCEWNMLAGVVASDDEADGIEYRIFLLHQSDYKINDTWNATGLCGTGSNDVKVSDAFVADYMSIAISDLTGGPTPGSSINPNALENIPIAAVAASASAVGRKVQGWSVMRQVATAPVPAGFFHFTRLMVPENVNSERSPDFSTPRRKISEPPARVISPSHSTSSPSCAASRKSQENDTVTPGPSSTEEAIANRQ